MTQTRRRVIDDDALWVTAQRLGEFSYYQLAAEAHVGLPTVERVVRKWVGQKLILKLGKGAHNRIQFRVVEGVAPAQLAGSLHGNMWRSMQMLKVFTCVDLAAHSNTPTVAVSEDDARAYVQSLLAAGYLRVRTKARLPARPAVYHLVNWTGPKPPMLRRIRAIIDPNTGTVTPTDRRFA